MGDRTKTAPTPSRKMRRARFASLPRPERLAAMFTAVVRERTPKPEPEDDGAPRVTRVPVLSLPGYATDTTGAVRRTAPRRGKRARQRATSR